MSRWKGWLLKLVRAAKVEPTSYIGAVHGHRFVVIRRPIDTIEYGGWSGALARQAFEQAHPNTGEVVELWDYDICRGRKEL